MKTTTMKTTTMKTTAMKTTAMKTTTMKTTMKTTRAATTRRHALSGAMLTLAVLAVAPGSAAGQQAGDAAGTWRATWASGIRTEADGTVTVQRREEAVLELAEAGDSLAGTWTFDFEPVGRAVWQVHGHLNGDRLTLVATESEMENPPPPSQGRIVRQRWTGTVEGHRVEGQQWLYLRLPDGRELESGPRPWSAVRDGG